MPQMSVVCSERDRDSSISLLILHFCFVMFHHGLFAAQTELKRLQFYCTFIYRRDGRYRDIHLRRHRRSSCSAQQNEGLLLTLLSWLSLKMCFFFHRDIIVVVVVNILDSLFAFIGLDPHWNWPNNNDDDNSNNNNHYNNNNTHAISRYLSLSLSLSPYLLGIVLTPLNALDATIQPNITHTHTQRLLLLLFMLFLYAVCLLVRVLYSFWWSLILLIYSLSLSFSFFLSLAYHCALCEPTIYYIH